MPNCDEAIRKTVKISRCRQIARQIAKENFPWECSVCNSIKYLRVHHKDGNPCNNSVENLQVVCRKHHLKIHGNPMSGRHHSERAKRKMATHAKGRKATRGTREKMSLARKGSKNPMYGQHHSEETRKKLRLSWKRRKEKNC